MPFSFIFRIVTISFFYIVIRMCGKNRDTMETSPYCQLKIFTKCLPLGCNGDVIYKRGEETW